MKENWEIAVALVQELYNLEMNASGDCMVAFE